MTDAELEFAAYSPGFLFVHGWFTDENDDPFDTDVHVLPANDLKPHETSRRCWCCPAEDTEAPCVVVHNSLDQREQHQHGGKPAH